MSGIKIRRWALLATILVFAIAGYLLLLLGSLDPDLPQERKFRAAPDAAPSVHLYFEIVSVDAVRNALQVHISVEPGGLGIDAHSMLPDRDLVLIVTHEKREARIEIHAHQPIPTSPIELDLYDGDIINYPLDVYHAGLSIRCVDASASSGSQLKLLPIDLTIWERVLGFRLQTSKAPGRVAGENKLTFEIQRSLAFKFFAFAIYGAMVMLAGVALIIGALTFLGIRRPEAALVGALGAIVFALPALRNAVPGGIPLGILADVFVYLWAELAVVFALLLLVTTWVRSGPVP